MRAHFAVALTLLCGCTARSLDFETVELESIRFSVPTDWQRTDFQTRNATTASWTPEENERKESLVVIRSVQPATSRADRTTLERLLAESHKVLPNARVGAITPVASIHGISGLRVDVTFVPQGLRHEYHRVHALLVAGPAVVNIIYTARNPRGSSELVNAVIDSLRREEG